MKKSSGGVGLVVLGVEAESPAAEAGLCPAIRNRSGSIRVGDRILAVDEKEVRSPEELSDWVEEHQVGDKVKLRILREGELEPQELSVELGTRPNRSGEQIRPEKDAIDDQTPRSNL